MFDQFFTIFGIDVKEKPAHSVFSTAILVSGCFLSSRKARNFASVGVIKGDTKAVRSGHSYRDMC